MLSQKNSFFLSSFASSRDAAIILNSAERIQVWRKQLQLDGGYIDETGQPLTTQKNGTNQMMEWMKTFGWTNYFFMIPVLSGIRDGCLFVSILWAKRTIRNNTRVRCVISQWHMSHGLQSLEQEFGVFNYMTVGCQLFSAAEWQLWIKSVQIFISCDILFLRWPAYLLKMTTPFSSIGQSVCSFATRWKYNWNANLCSTQLQPSEVSNTFLGRLNHLILSTPLSRQWSA